MRGVQRGHLNLQLAHPHGNEDVMVRGRDRVLSEHWNNKLFEMGVR